MGWIWRGWLSSGCQMIIKPHVIFGALKIGEKPMAAQPIKPSQVIKKKKDSIPDFVIESFNELIVKHFNGSYSTIQQDEVLSVILSKMPEGSTRQNVFDNNWLDVEDIFRKAGWQVNYDKPAYNESYPATFKFDPKRKR